MSAQIIVLAEERDKRAQARPQRRTDERRAALTKARLIQEAIDEAIATGAPCDYESIMVTVAEYERSVQNER